MNYCLKCRSIYEKAGTCNCFASSDSKDDELVDKGMPDIYPKFIKKQHEDLNFSTNLGRWERCGWSYLGPCDEELGHNDDWKPTPWVPPWRKEEDPIGPFQPFDETLGGR